MNTEKSFVKGRVKSLRYALKGMWILVSSEHSIITQLLLFGVAIALGFIFEISHIEWMIQILCFGLIFATEGMNTAVEEVANFIHPDYHSKIGKIKDIAAGAVTFAALTTLIVSSIIYLPKIF